MILPVHDVVRRRIAAVLQDHFGLAPADCPTIVIDYPPTRELGDLALPLAFELARRLRKAPRLIAEEIAAQAGDIPGVARVEAVNGYLNLFLTRPAFLLERLAAGKPEAVAVTGAAAKTIVEHTAINPNKAAHIGHLRNSALGDTLVRALRFRGTPVEVQNYIDDTGVQVADVVVGFRQIEKKNLTAVRAIADSTRFDFLLLGPLRACGRLVRRGQDPPAVPARHAARHRAWRQRGGRNRLVHRRPHRPLPPRHDGPDERGLRPAGVGGRHPAAALLGPRVRDPEGEGRGLPPDAGSPGRLLGDADRGRSRRRRTRDGEATGRGGRGPREGHRPLQRHRHLRRQGHGLSVVEVRPARQGLPLPGLQPEHGGPPGLGDLRLRSGEPPATRRSAARARCSTSSTSGSRTSRNC